MVEDDDVRLVESIGGIHGTPPTWDIQSMHMHGSVGVSSIVTSNPIVVALNHSR
jgi:hypothetical protein